MKSYILSIVGLSLCIGLYSCGKEKSGLQKEINNAVETIDNAMNVANHSEQIKNDILQLRKTTPLTKEQFESWVPETLLELPRSNVQINLMPGISSCSATYKIGNRRVQFTVIDGAGEKGAGAVGVYRMSQQINYNQEENWGYTKTKTIEGLKVKESFLKDSNSYQVSLFFDNRYAVNVRSYEVSYEELKQIFKELNLPKLSHL